MRGPWGGPAMLAHPLEQPRARTDHRVRQLDADLLGDLLAKARNRVGHFVRSLREQA